MKMKSLLLAVALLFSTSCQQHQRFETSKDENKVIDVIDVLNKTIIPNLDWPEQNIKDRLLIIRGEAAKVGVAVEWSDEVNNSRRRWESLRVRNIPILEAIRFMGGNTVLISELKDPNILYFKFSSEVPSSIPDSNMPTNPEHPDPFDPRHHAPFLPK